MPTDSIRPLQRGPDARAAATEQGGTAVCAPTAAAPADSADELDAAALERLRELDPSGANHLLERVLNAFRSSSARLLPQLRAAQQQGDAAGVRHVAHTLKSSAASIGAIKLAALCAEIESMIRLGPIEAVQGRVDAVDREVASALHALAQWLGVRP